MPVLIVNAGAVSIVYIQAVYGHSSSEQEQLPVATGEPAFSKN